MGKAKMLGQFKPYTPNNRTATPGRKKTFMVVGQPIVKQSEMRDLVNRYCETKEK